MQLSVLLPKYRIWTLAKVLSNLSNFSTPSVASTLVQLSISSMFCCMISKNKCQDVAPVWQQTPLTYLTSSYWHSLKKEHYPFVFPAERKQDQSLYFTLEYLLDISSSLFEDVCCLLLAVVLFFFPPFFVAVCCSTPLVLVGGTFIQRLLNMNKFNLSKSNWFYANSGTL